MDELISRLFGFNRTNLFGWIVSGLLVLGIAAYFGYCAYESAPKTVGPELWLLACIASLLFGILCVLLQIYAGFVGDKLEKESPPRKSTAAAD